MVASTVEIPQANDLSKVAAVPAALLAGCSTPAEVAEALGVDNRQGSYYLQAARTLGLVDCNEIVVPYEWTPTELGAQVTELEGDARAVLMSNILADCEFLDVLTSSEGVDALVKDWEMAGLDGDTVRRRLATVKRWAEFFNMSPEGRAKLLDKSHVETQSRSAQVVARRPKKAVSEARFCSSCGMVIPPALASCENC